MTAQIDLFACLDDNFGCLIHDRATGATACIDAPHDGPILEALARTGWQLSDIFITHHHADHTQGIAALKSATGARATGPRAEADKIPGLDFTVAEGDMLMLGDTAFAIIATPGHTLGHIAYFAPDDKMLFAGDALFSLGCGRMFEGTPDPMWEGLKKLRALPDETLLYCGHEYTATNAAFALSIDPDNQSLLARADAVSALRAAGKFTIPARMGDEKKQNPFLRADDAAMARVMGLEGAEPAAIFAAIRKAKDRF